MLLPVYKFLISTVGYPSSWTYSGKTISIIPSLGTLYEDITKRVYVTPLLYVS